MEACTSLGHVTHRMDDGVAPLLPLVTRHMIRAEDRREQVVGETCRLGANSMPMRCTRSVLIRAHAHGSISSGRCRLRLGRGGGHERRREHGDQLAVYGDPVKLEHELL